MRNYSVITRSPNIVDAITPMQTGVEAYRFEWAANFDSAVWTLLVDAPRVSGWLDPQIVRDGKRDILSVISNRDIVRFTFDPATFSIPDETNFWMRMTPISGGVPGTAGTLGLILPNHTHKGVGRFNIKGTAPNVAQNAALVLELPRGMQDFVFLVDSGGSPLGLAFDETEPEFEIPAGTQIVFKDGIQTQLIVRGVGGTSDFQVSFLNAFPL